MTISLSYKTTKVAPGAVIVISFDSDCDYLILCALMNSSPSVETLESTAADILKTKKFDCTNVCYSLYETIKGRLTGSIFLDARNKIAGMNCSVQDEKFIISITCAGTGTAVKKIITQVCKLLDPSKVKARYVLNCRALDVKPDSDAFNAAAADLTKSIKSKLNIFIGGKVKINSDLEKRIEKTAADKLAASSPDGKGKDREVELAARPVLLSSKSCGDSLSGFFAKKYGESAVLSNAIHLVGGKILAHQHVAKKMESAASKDRVKAYVEKVTRLGDDAVGAVLYIAARDALMSADKLSSAKNINESSIVSNVLGCLSSF